MERKVHGKQRSGGVAHADTHVPPGSSVTKNNTFKLGSGRILLCGGAAGHECRVEVDEIDNAGDRSLQRVLQGLGTVLRDRDGGRSISWQLWRRGSKSTTSFRR